MQLRTQLRTTSQHLEESRVELATLHTTRERQHQVQEGKQRELLAEASKLRELFESTRKELEEARMELGAEREIHQEQQRVQESRERLVESTLVAEVSQLRERLQRTSSELEASQQQLAAEQHGLSAEQKKRGEQQLAQETKERELKAELSELRELFQSMLCSSSTLRLMDDRMK